MIKTLNKLGGKKNFLNLTKGFQEKCTGNITLNCEKLNAFSLRSGTRQLHPLKSLPFNIVLASVIRQEKQIKSIWIGKKNDHVCRKSDEIQKKSTRHNK